MHIGLQDIFFQNHPPPPPPKVKCLVPNSQGQEHLLGLCRAVEVVKVIV